MRGIIALFAAGIVALLGCGCSPGHRHVMGGSTGYHHVVHGTFGAAGGPPPGSPFPLSGTITARAVTGQTYTATVGRNGRFTLSLPPGSYQVTGRSPLIQSGHTICPAMAKLRVTRGKPAGPVTVVCSIR